MPLVSGDGVPISVCAFLMFRVPESCSQFATRERHKKPPAGAGEDVSREPAASCRSSLGGPLPACRQPGPPGLALPQKAPGGSRGTPGRMPSRVPCAVGLNRELCAVIRHGRRGGFHARCPRVSTRGFLDGRRDRFPIQRICKQRSQANTCTGQDGGAGVGCRRGWPAFKAQPAPATMAVQAYKRRARDSNPQPLSGHLISSQTASRSLTLRGRF